MSNKNFKTSIQVDATPEQVFKAINNVREWWSENIDGKTDEVNAEFFYHNKDAHLCKIEIAELIPDEKVVWFVKDNFFIFTKNHSEWKDTKITFEISNSGDKTRVDFTHHGLTPEYECYEICEGAWSMFITESLKELIVSGKGKALPRLKEGYDTEFVEKWKKA